MMAKELDSQLIINEEIYNINANNAKIADEAKKVLGTNVEGPVAFANTTNAITQFNWEYNSEREQYELTSSGTEGADASLDLFKKTKGIIFVWGDHPEQVHADPGNSNFFFKPFLESLETKPNALIFYYCILPAGSPIAGSPEYYESNMPEFYLYSPWVSGDKVLSFSEYRIPHHSTWAEKALEAKRADQAYKATYADLANKLDGGHLQGIDTLTGADIIQRFSVLEFILFGHSGQGLTQDKLKEVYDSYYDLGASLDYTPLLKIPTVNPDSEDSEL